MRNGIPEPFNRLSREAAIAPGLDKCDRRHDRDLPGTFCEELLNRKKSRLRIQRVEDRFDEQQVDAAVQQTAYLLAIGLHQFRIRGPACCRVIGVCRH